MTEVEAGVAGSREGLSVVVPVYNGAATLGELVERLERVLEAEGRPWEILLVNDGSRDRSWDVIRELGRRKGVRGLDLMRNYGQHNAILCGLREASYDVTITLDDDLQNPPEEIPKLLRRLEESFDVVYGRPQGLSMNWARAVASRFIRFLFIPTLGRDAARYVTGFRAFRTRLRDAFADYRSPFVSLDVLLTWGTTRFGAVDVRHDPRRSGRSNYGFVKLFVHAVDHLTGFSTVPLRVASGIGFVLTLFGGGVLVWVVGRYVILGYSVPGFPFLASIIAIFSGAQLFALGIIGEYLSRIHFRTMGRPHGVVRARVPDEDDGRGTA